MKVLIIDSSYLIYRSFFAYPNLSVLNPVKTQNIVSDQNLFEDNSLSQLEKIPLGGFYGFVKTVMYLIKDLKVDQLVFTFDLPKATWRHKVKTDYKAGRPKPEESMISQIPIIKQWCQMVTENCFESEGFEADDCIFSVCKKTSSLADKIYIFSSDKDLYQLLTNHKISFVKSKAAKLTFFGKKEFETKYEISPQQWVFCKSLMGDSSDNLQGLTGVGEKTALKIVKHFQNLSNLFKALEVDLPENFSTMGFEDGFKDTKDLKEKWLAGGKKHLYFFEQMKKESTSILENYRLSRLQLVSDCSFLEKGFFLEKGLPFLEQYGFKSLVKTWEKYFKNRGKTADQVQQSLF